MTMSEGDLAVAQAEIRTARIPLEQQTAARALTGAVGCAARICCRRRSTS